MVICGRPLFTKVNESDDRNVYIEVEKLTFNIFKDWAEMCTLFGWPVNNDIPMFMKPEVERMIAEQAKPECDPIEDAESSQEFATAVQALVLPESETTASQLEFEKSVAALHASSASSSTTPPPPVPPRIVQQWPNSRKPQRSRGQIFNSADDDSDDEDLQRALELFEKIRANRGLQNVIALLNTVKRRA